MLRRVQNKIYSQSKFKPYRVSWAKDSYQETVRKVESQTAENSHSLGISNYFSLYERIIQELRDLPNIQFCSLKDFQKLNHKEKIIVALRHDIDIDGTTGIRCARYLARYGIPSTFFILHTAHYYGYFKDNIFYRNSAMKNILIDLFVTGCEIGFHIDPLSIYINYKIDGAAALKTELEWLRGGEAKIVGTVAHNSGPLYGAENFEIFKEKAFQNRAYLRYKNLRVPLQVLDEANLRLDYEGNFVKLRKKLNKRLLKHYFSLPLENAVVNKEWMKIYLNNNPYFERGYDYTIWLNGMNSWIISGHRNNQHLFLWNVMTDELIKFFYGRFFKGKKVVFVIHPCCLAKDRNIPRTSLTTC